MKQGGVPAHRHLPLWLGVPVDKRGGILEKPSNILKLLGLQSPVYSRHKLVIMRKKAKISLTQLLYVHSDKIIGLSDTKNKKK